MKQAIEKFEQHIKSRYPNSPTHKHYVYDLRQFDRLIGKPPSAITRADVQRFVDAQLECGRAPTTINRRLAALRVFFEYLAMETENDEWLNPVNWKQQKVKQGKPLPRDISEAEVERLFEAVTQHRDKAMFRRIFSIFRGSAGYKGISDIFLTRMRQACAIIGQSVSSDLRKTQVYIYEPSRTW